MSKKNTRKPKSLEAEDVTDHVSTYDPDPYFSILDLYFEQDKQILVKHQIDSFNQLIEEIIPNIVQGGDNIISEKASENKIIRYRLTFDDLGIKPPTLDNDEGPMFPLDAIQKSLTYAAKYTATVTQHQDIIDISTGRTETRIIGAPEKDVPIAKIPIMVGSKYCNLILRPDLVKKHCKYDAGGYFIVIGSEKVVLSIETMIHRKPLVFIKKDQNANIFYVEVQSRPATQFAGSLQRFIIRIKKDNSIILSISQFKDVSIFTLMRALGLETDEDIVDAILDVNKEKDMLNLLSICMSAANTPTITQEEAIELLISSMKYSKNYSESDPEIMYRQKREHLMKILSQIILPHVKSKTGKPDIDMLYKAHYIGYMIHKLLACYMSNSPLVEELRGCDDRDSMINKRIELSGILLGGLFDQFFKKMLIDCNKIFKSKNVDDKKPPNIVPHIKPNPIEQGLRRALSTGSFGGQTRNGLSQRLNRMNHLSAASYMRRLITPTVDASTNKMTSPRNLHNTHYGSLCPVSTPEGSKTGLVKNMALLANVTVNMNSQIPIIEKYLEGKIIPLENVNRKKLHTYVKVFINGNWVGLAEDIISIHANLRKMRFQGELERTVGLVCNFAKREFHIYTEGGRMVRPYLTVTNNKLNFQPEMLTKVNSWEQFIATYPGVIEYLDNEEEQNMMLASFPQYIEIANRVMVSKPITDEKSLDKINKTNRYDGNAYARYTHCEIHPCTMFDIVTSNIPFPNHNQGSRIIFSYGQMMQAMGLYISDYRERTDISYILYHPQLPIVTSKASKYTGSQIFPAGENIIVAIASYTGYNQEDSLVMNLSAIQKGLFRAQALKKYFETIKKNPASSQTGIFLKPDRNKVDNMKDANYDKLTEEGYCKVETVINDGDVIIGMVNPKPTYREDEKPYRDNSTIYRSLIPGAIDKVITGLNSDGYPIIKIRVRSERIPMIGDKFTSRAGQKGTMGIRTLRPDLPFTVTGLVPDVIINPNCMPKRMTIGQLVECFMSKVCAVKGVFGDGTPFNTIDFKTMNKELMAGGFEEWGNETMYNGMTGQKMTTKIFIGPTYYQRLKQMVGDKTHCLSTDHEVLTADGWKYNHQLSVNDTVATLLDGKLVYQKPIQILNYPDYKGDMYHVKTKQLDLLVTPNHRMFVSKHDGHKWLDHDFELAADIVHKRRRYKADAEWDAADYQLELPIEVADTDSWLTFFGIWISAGWCSVNSPRRVICQCNKQAMHVLVVAINKLSYSYAQHGNKLVITNIRLYAYLKQFSDKFLPDWVWQLSASQARILLGSMTISRNAICTSSNQLADDVMRLALHCGWSSNKVTECAKRDIYRLTINKCRNAPPVHPVHVTHITSYDKPVFCLEVPGGVFYVRRNGKPVWTGNSRARGPVQLLTRQPPEGRSRDGGLRIGEMERDAICAHGCAQFLKERMVDNSDIYTAFVCDICGLFAHRVPDKKYYICTGCKNTTRISTIIIPYAFKLFMHELRSIHILGRIRTSKSIVAPVARG